MASYALVLGISMPFMASHALHRQISVFVKIPISYN